MHPIISNLKAKFRNQTSTILSEPDVIDLTEPATILNNKKNEFLLESNNNEIIYPITKTKIKIGLSMSTEGVLDQIKIIIL